jgi:hypothetical protein
LFALRPAFGMQGKGFACFHHELTVIFHIRPPTLPITACPLTWTCWTWTTWLAPL